MLLTLPTSVAFILIGVLAFGLLHPGAASANTTIRYVAPVGNCGGAAPCYSAIQTAVDASATGDEIRIAAGTYTGVNDYGDLSQLVYIDKTVTVLGGFTITDWDNADPESNPTVLDAQGQGRVLYITGAISPTIEGLHITGGDASDLRGEKYGRDAGGGVYITDAEAIVRVCFIYGNTGKSISGSAWAYGGGVHLEASPTILESNVVYANVASNKIAGLGGGISLQDSDAVLINNTIRENTSSTASWGEGGGVLIIGGRPELNHNLIISNTASTLGDGWGGGLYVSQTEAKLNGNVIRANVVSNDGYGRGGGLYLSEGRNSLSQNIIVENRTTLNPLASGEGGGLHMVTHNPFTFPITLTNNILAGNHATSQGSGIWLWGNGDSLISATLKHNTIADNVGSGQGLYVGRNSAATLTNNIVVGHASYGVTTTIASTVTLESTLWHGNGQHAGGLGIINSIADVYGDPAFVGNGNYHISSGSAAFDMGTKTDTTQDVDDEERPQGKAPDIGADELPAVVVTPGASTVFAYDDTLSIAFPATAVVSETVVAYRPLEAVGAAPTGLSFAGNAFNLEAFVDGALKNDFVFADPVTITITYSEDNFVGLDESTLELLFWDGSAWSDAGIVIVERDMTNDRLVATIDHLSDFALFVQEQYPFKAFLPTILKNPG